jgi:CO/xanthine dehydrogenase Mo-binding subunit
MGVGEALLEEDTLREGVYRTPSILEYRIPTSVDTPPIEVHLVESHDPEGPLGAKEAGEGPQLSTVPAVGNAIYDATGVWFTDAPFYPERVLKGIERAKRRAEQRHVAR